MTILDGKALSNKIKEEVKVEVEELQSTRHITPGLAVILVGNDPASSTYVGMRLNLAKMQVFIQLFMKCLIQSHKMIF